MKSIKGTQTEKNLLANFAGESQARNRYTYFASQAKKKALSKYRGFLLIRQIMKKNTQNVFSSSSKVAISRSPRLTQQGS